MKTIFRKRNFLFKMDDLLALLHVKFFLWSITLLVLMEDDVAMLAFMFS